LLRQGDVLLIPVDEVPMGTRKVGSDGRRVVLAEGEATGHAHALVTSEAELRLAYDDTLFLLIAGEEAAALVHEEHDTVTIEPGVYEVRRQREYEPFRRPRLVVD